MDGRIVAMYEKAVKEAGTENGFNTTQLHVAHKFAQMVMTYEREACAKLCDEQMSSYLYADEWFNNGARACSRAIRERNKL